MEPFRLWMLKATTTQQKKLARAARLTQGYLYQIAQGTREAGADAAGRIAKGAEKIRQADRKSELPRITRADIARACARCEYAKQCIKR